MESKIPVRLKGDFAIKTKKAQKAESNINKWSLTKITLKVKVK